MNFKKFLIGGAAGALMLGVLSVTAFAATPQGQNLNASVCNTKGAPVVNITYKVINDPDSGLNGNWALDNYNKKVQVWDQGSGTFCVIVKYDGQFVTTGPLSPQAGVFLSAGIKGAFEGGYQATFNGTLATGLQTNGNLPTVDQSAEPFSWLGTYFPGYTSFTEPYWSWTYHAGNNGTWVNSLVNSGDITGN